MSRIGKLPILVPANVQIELTADQIKVKGPKGELTQELNSLIEVQTQENEITVTRVNDEKEAKSMHGLYRTLIQNMITGVTTGFEKQLEIQGVGYRAAIQGSKIVLNLGYSHPVEYQIPHGIEVKIDADKKNILIVTGIDKQAVGQTAAEIRSYRKPEPYKGKGIRYVGERIIRKAGKTAAAK
jgi:large subunit ribosomal protein L6